MKRNKADIHDFVWWLCVFFFGFIMALALMSAAWEFEVTPAVNESDDAETVTEEVVTTLESSRVSGSSMPVEPIPRKAQPTEVYETPELKLLARFIVTAYCACERCCDKSPDDPAYGITATGTKATQGRTIAVDPRVIPYGTVLYFEGPDGLIGGYVAEDCGGAIKGNRLDLYFDSHEEAIEWGIKEKDIYII